MRPASLDPGQTLTPEDLKVVGAALFGRWGWQTRLAEALEVDGSTVRRWVSGAVAVPQPAKVALRLMLEARFPEDFRGVALEAVAEKRPAKRRS